MPRRDRNFRRNLRDIFHDLLRAGARWIVIAVAMFPSAGCGKAAGEAEVRALAARLCELYDERQTSLKPGFTPPAPPMEELAPFLDAFQSLVRHPDYSLDDLMAQSGAEPSGEPRPGRMLIVATAARLMRLRVLDQALRGEHEEALRSAADCFRAGRTSPSSPALCLWYCSLISAYARSNASVATWHLGGDPQTAEEHLLREELLERVAPAIEETLETVRDFQRMLDEIIEENPEGTDDPSLSGMPEGNPDHAWFESYCQGVSVSAIHVVTSLKVGRVHLDHLLREYTALKESASSVE